MLENLEKKESLNNYLETNSKIILLKQELESQNKTLRNYRERFKVLSKTKDNFREKYEQVKLEFEKLSDLFEDMREELLSQSKFIFLKKVELWILLAK